MFRLYLTSSELVRSPELRQKRRSANIAESLKKKQEIQNVLIVLMDTTSPPGLESK